MMAEDMNTYQNAIYLSLNQTLGGAFCIGEICFPEKIRRPENLDI